MERLQFESIDSLVLPRGLKEGEQHVPTINYGYSLTKREGPHKEMVLKINSTGAIEKVKLENEDEELAALQDRESGGNRDSKKCRNRECNNLSGQEGKPRSIYCSKKCQSREQNLRQGRVKQKRAKRDHVEEQETTPKIRAKRQKTKNEDIPDSRSKAPDSPGSGSSASESPSISPLSNMITPPGSTFIPIQNPDVIAAVRANSPSGFVPIQTENSSLPVTRGVCLSPFNFIDPSPIPSPSFELPSFSNEIMNFRLTPLFNEGRISPFRENGRNTPSGRFTPSEWGRTTPSLYPLFGGRVTPCLDFLM